MTNSVTIALPDRQVSLPVLCFDELTSTNDYVKTHTQEWAGKSVVVRAEYQTQGRGQFDRVWESSRGKDLLFSILIRPQIDVSRAPQLTVMTAHALMDAITATTSLSCTIKHPNDVLCRGKKLAGILTEQVTMGSVIQSVVVGVGLNCNSDGEDLVAGATSVYQEGGSIVDRDLLFQEALQRFFTHYAAFLKKNGGCDEGIMH